jgi:hypothetical protein
LELSFDSPEILCLPELLPNHNVKTHQQKTENESQDWNWSSTESTGKRPGTADEEVLRLYNQKEHF